MSSEVLDHLGLACNGTGSFFVCHDMPSQFIGCCGVDPCKRDDGLCPDDKLQSSTYDKYIHKEIGKQDCQSGREDVLWYTCAEVDPPFMGCCSENPCGTGCPDDKLYPAKLSPDEEVADVFKPSEARSSATASSTSDSDSDGGLSKGAVGGIAAGASIGGLLIIGAIVFMFLRKRKQKKHAHAPVSTYDPYSGAPTIVGPGSEGPGSPLPQKEHPHFSPVTTPFSPVDQQMAQYNNVPGSPQYWQQQQHHNPHMSMQSMSSHQGLGMSPSPFTGSQTSPVPSQAQFNRDSMATAYMPHDGNQQQFVQELPASQEYIGGGGNGPNTFAAEMEAPDNPKK